MSSEFSLIPQRHKPLAEAHSRTEKMPHYTTENWGKSDFKISSNQWVLSSKLVMFNLFIFFLPLAFLSSKYCALQKPSDQWQAFPWLWQEHRPARGEVRNHSILKRMASFKASQEGQRNEPLLHKSQNWGRQMEEVLKAIQSTSLPKSRKNDMNSHTKP